MAPFDKQIASATTWWQLIACLPTRYHLFCAEQELRAVATNTLSQKQRCARQNNLTRLRTYRARRQFPRNTHTTITFSPCFVDQDGRLCAVAYLLHHSGHAEIIRHVARTTNYARLAQMDSIALDAWAVESGLTKAELARIQPGYPPDIETLHTQYSNITTAIAVIGTIGTLSVIANSFRLIWSYLQRFTVIAGTLLGIVLLYLSNSAFRVSRGFEGYALFYQGADITSYTHALQLYGISALIAGLLSIMVAFLRYWIHRRQEA
jgi:hypothetical protein